MTALMQSLSPEELRMIRVGDRTFWSDEVEMLAKLRGDLLCYLSRRPVDWRKLLPERFVEGATVADVPKGEKLKGITRGLSRILDGFVATLTGKNRVHINR